MLRSSLFREGEDDSSCASPRSAQPGENHIYRPTQKPLPPPSIRVRRQRQETGRQEVKECTPEIGSGRSGSFGPPGARQKLWKCGCEGSYWGFYPLATLRLYVCVFWCWSHPVVGKPNTVCASRCWQMWWALLNFLSHTQAQKWWHTSFLCDRWRRSPRFTTATVNKRHIGKPPSSWGMFTLLFQMFCN